MKKKKRQRDKHRMNHDIPVLYNEPSLHKLELANKIKNDRETMLGNGELLEDKLYIFEKASGQELTLRLDVGGQQLLDVGGIIASMKEVLPHGRFLAWVKKYFPFSERKALYLMSAHLLVTMFPPLGALKISLLNILNKKDFPSELIELIACHCENIHVLKRKDIIEMLDVYQRGELVPGRKEFQNIFKTNNKLIHQQLYDNDLSKIVKMMENKKRQLTKKETHQTLILQSSYQNHYNYYLRRSIATLNTAIISLKELRDLPAQKTVNCPFVRTKFYRNTNDHSVSMYDL